MRLGRIAALAAGDSGIVMGRLLARHLGLALGDQVRVTLPDIAITPAGVYPRVRRFTLVGVFEVGAQMDQTLVMIHLDDAQRLLRRSGPQRSVERRVGQEVSCSWLSYTRDKE